MRLLTNACNCCKVAPKSVEATGGRTHQGGGRGRKAEQQQRRQQLDVGQWLCFALSALRWPNPEFYRGNALTFVKLESRQVGSTLSIAYCKCGHTGDGHKHGCRLIIDQEVVAEAEAETAAWLLENFV